MVHPSNPRLMNRVLDAVAHLCDGKGSRAREVIDYLRQTSKSPPRNLTMQVHRALKHAVNAGLLRHRSGRYKALFTLNPAPVKQPAIEEKNETSNDAANIFAEKQTAPKTKTVDDVDTEDQRTKHRARKRRRSRDDPRRRKWRSGSRKRNSDLKQRGDKNKTKRKGESSRTVKQRISNSRLATDIGHASRSTKRKRNSERLKDDQSYHSDPSESDYESRKTKVRRRTLAYQESKYKEGIKPSEGSTSRSCSLERQPSQQLHLKYSYDDAISDKRNADDARNDATHQGEEERQQPDDSGSGSS